MNILPSTILIYLSFIIFFCSCEISPEIEDERPLEFLEYFGGKKYDSGNCVQQTYDGGICLLIFI